MKKLIYILFIVLVASLQSCCTLKQVKYTKNYSEIFTTYTQKFDTVLVYTIHTNNEINPPITIIGLKNQLWEKIEFQSRKKLLLNDSLNSSPCFSCKQVFEKIVTLDLINLPSENQLTTPCRSFKDTIVNGKELVEINELDGIADLAIHQIEYKIGKKKGNIAYRSPLEALTICPNSIERRRFNNIINLLKEL